MHGLKLLSLAGMAASLLATPLLAGETAKTASAAPPRPAFKPLRYDEDWSLLRDPALRTRPGDFLKHLTAGGGHLSFGGEAREMMEGYRNDSFSTGPDADSVYFLQRYLLHLDWHPTPALRFFTQFQSAFEDGKPGDSDRNALDLHQFFADAVMLRTDGGGTLTLRAGRQELSYGSERLIGVRDGTNNRRAFDAARLIWKSGGGGGGGERMDFFAGRPVEWDQGVFDDQTVDGDALGGIHATLPLTNFLPGLSLDLYLLGLERGQASFSQGTGHEDRWTLGTRLFGKRGSWDFNDEAMLQGGRFAGGDILAWSLATDHGFTWEHLPGKPRLSLKAAIASGDRDAGDHDLQTFNPLYPRGSYFTEASLLGPRNFMDLRPGLRLQPAEALTLDLSADFYWRHQRADGIYRPGGSVIYPGNPAASRFVGTDLSLSAEWTLSPRLTLACAATHFITGPFIRDQGGADVDYGSVWVTWRF
ncbi:MAG: hypothetical protein JWM59_4060 [Verrucomicrobiales bacterium]|nr:hypothetical protein [Verrucomicrobiales bacterium]